MSFLTRVATGLGFKSAPRTMSIDELAKKLDSGFANGTGFSVSHQHALQVSTVFACTKMLMDGCGTPELNLYRLKADNTRELARELPEFRVLNRRPNEWQTSFEFRRTMTMHAVLTGNALAIKVVGGDGRLRELIPVMPQNWQIEEMGRYDVRYRVFDKWGLIGVFEPNEVFHLPGPSWDGLEGLDAIKLARAAIGLGLAAESTQASLHANGGRPAGILTTEQPTSKDVVQKLREYWSEFSGKNRQGTAILDNGFKYQPMLMTGVDAQHLETRRFQVEEICRFFGISPVVIGHSDKMPTLPGAVEGYFGTHYRQALYPWHVCWTQRLDEFVLDGNGPLFCEFDTRYLRQGSIKDRAAYARVMIELGVWTRNEWRDEDRMDPLPGLDQPLTPMNMSQGTGKTPTVAPTDPDDEEN
jgi:HK97 family phage portal protein